jgi:hypothetical protein
VSFAIAGSFDGNALFSTFPLAALGVDDAYVMKLNAAGTVQWARQLGGTSSDVGLSLAFTPSGSVVTAGYFYGSGSFGGVPLSSAGAADVFIASLAP